MAEQLLITGATSTVGRHFLGEMWNAYPDLEVVLLGWKEEKGQYEKLRKELETEHRLWDGQLVLHLGDVGDSVLGIKEPLYEDLRQSVSYIVHLAQVGHGETDKERLIQTNVIGSENVVYFASRCPNLRLMVHRSDVCVGGVNGPVLTEGPCEHDRSFQTLYARSQYEAEESVRMLMTKTPVTILRLGYLLTEQNRERLVAAARWSKRVPKNPGLGDATPMPCTTPSAGASLLCDLIRDAEAAAGKTIHSVHSQPLSGQQVWSLVAEAATGNTPNSARPAGFWTALTALPLIGRSNPLTPQEISRFYQGLDVEINSEFWRPHDTIASSALVSWLESR